MISHDTSELMRTNSVMGRLVLMSSNTKFKMTTIQREVWFITKIVSCLALGLFCVALIVWAAWLRVDHAGFATASGAIINSIGCLTAFVPQVSREAGGMVRRAHWRAGTAGLRRCISYHHCEAHGQAKCARQEPGYDRGTFTFALQTPG